MTQPAKPDDADTAIWAYSVRLLAGGSAKERESYPSTPRGGKYCNQLNEQRPRIALTREHTAKAHRMISELCEQNELLPNLRHVVLDRLDVG